MFKSIGKYLKIGAVVILISSLCLFACAGSSKSTDSDKVEKTVQKTMKALKQLDLETFNARTDNYVRTYRNWIGIPTEKEYKVFSELQQPGFIRARIYKENKKFAEKVMENLEWNIKEVHEEGKVAQIDMEIRNKDMSNAMGKYTIHLMEDMIDESGEGLKEIVENLVKTHNQDDIIYYIEQEESTCAADITLSASKEEGSWKLHLSDAFINAIMGNMDSEEYSDEIEERLDELEHEYEQKMDEWGEEYADSVENRIEGMFE